MKTIVKIMGVKVMKILMKMVSERKLSGILKMNLIAVRKNQTNRSLKKKMKS